MKKFAALLTCILLSFSFISIANKSEVFAESNSNVSLVDNLNTVNELEDKEPFDNLTLDTNLNNNLINNISTVEKSVDFIPHQELLAMSIISYCNDPEEIINGFNCDINYSNRMFAGYEDDIDLQGWEIVNTFINLRMKDYNSFSAVTFKKDNNIVIAFRGTDSGLFWENKWYLLPLTTHPQANIAYEYVRMILESECVDNDTNVYLVGHSLGGYLCLHTYGEILLNNKLKDKITEVVTFNGLGIGITDSRKIHKLLKGNANSKITNYRIKGDKVSRIGLHFKKPITLKYIPLDINKCKNKHDAVSAHSLQRFLPHLCNSEDKDKYSDEGVCPYLL